VLKGVVPPNEGISVLLIGTRPYLRYREESEPEVAPRPNMRPEYASLLHPGSTVTSNLSKCNLDGCISNFQRYTLESVLATLGYGGREESRMGEATKPTTRNIDDQSQLTACI
jgi:hypothetical protein